MSNFILTGFDTRGLERGSKQGRLRPTFFALVAERCHSSTDPSGLIAPVAAWRFWLVVRPGSFDLFTDLLQSVCNLVKGALRRVSRGFLLTAERQPEFVWAWNFSGYNRCNICWGISGFDSFFCNCRFEHVLQGQQRWIFQTKCLWFS